jgi:hypothetical protein
MPQWYASLARELCFQSALMAVRNEVNFGSRPGSWKVIKAVVISCIARRQMCAPLGNDTVPKAR